MMLLIEVPSCASPPYLVEFSSIEQHAFAHVPDTADQVTQDNAIDQGATNYLNALFPPGYPVSKAVAESIKGGAECDYFRGSPQNGPPSYVCDFKRPGYGLAHFFVQIDWMIELDFDRKTGLIVSINASRQETGL